MSETSTTVTVDRDLLSDYRALILPRVIEEKMLRLIRQARISKWFSGYGQEAIAVGCTLALEDDDYIFPTHRNLGVWTTRGVNLEHLFCQMMGKEGGFTKGRDRSFHFGLPEKRIIGMISHMAAMLPVAVGVGLAAKLRGERRVALAFVGDGATREGDFHEALSLAGVWKVPVIFVVENNGFGLSTPTSDALPVTDIASAAAGYGMPGVVVDGNNMGAVMSAVRAAARRARDGEGATLIEMKTFRVRGHEEASGTWYVPDELIEEWSERDPVRIFEEELVSHGVDTETMTAIRSELAADINAIAEATLEKPLVSSQSDVELADVFAPAPAEPSPPTGSSKEMRFIDAISDGLAEAMRRDERIVLLGQDIADYGGVFKVTKGFVEEFGANRVLNTPIVESGAVGAAMGLGLEGFLPVLEIQYADFITCGFNQIVNNLATTHYRWGTPLNVTLRAPIGGYIGAGPFHSQSIESWFTHVPGLKVVMPSDPDSAKGLLLSAIEDPNPVLFFEHKFLYRSLKGEVHQGYHRVPIGEARIVREGADATVVTYGIGVVWAKEEAARLEKLGVSIEIIDLQTLVPWDRAAVLASVRKTGRVVILHEAGLAGGFGGEISSVIAEEAFDALDAPPVRVGGLGTPVPFSSDIEKHVYSARSRLAAALDRILSY